MNISILGDPGAVSREKSQDESFQVLAKEPLGKDSHRTLSENSSGCRLLIGHKKCFVLLCPIGEQFLLSSFREFVHDEAENTCGNLCRQECEARSKSYSLHPLFLGTYWKIPVLCPGLIQFGKEYWVGL